MLTTLPQEQLSPYVLGRCQRHYHFISRFTYDKAQETIAIFTSMNPNYSVLFFFFSLNKYADILKAFLKVFNYPSLLILKCHLHLSTKHIHITSLNTHKFHSLLLQIRSKYLPSHPISPAKMALERSVDNLSSSQTKYCFRRALSSVPPKY